LLSLQENIKKIFDFKEDDAFAKKFPEISSLLSTIIEMTISNPSAFQIHTTSKQLTTFFKTQEKIIRNLNEIYTASKQNQNYLKGTDVLQKLSGLISDLKSTNKEFFPQLISLSRTCAKFAKDFDHTKESSLSSNEEDEEDQLIEEEVDVLDQKTNEEQRSLTSVDNLYAINVIKRVKQKLQGRDKSEIEKISVKQQVQSLIQDATNINNLAQLFEGWSSWI